jgi:hypothetical protein
MREIDNVFVQLGGELVDNDDLGISVGTEEELIFRTMRLIVVTQLERIEQAIRSMPTSNSDDALKAYASSRSLQAIAVARSELHRITSEWLRNRYGDPGATAAAFRDLRSLEENAEVERMLYRGVASKYPVIANACEQILVAIQVHIDLQTARRLWATRRNIERVLGRQ